MLETTLKQFGLSEKEISVYLAVLKLGPSAVRKIAKEANVNRGTTYDILKSLMVLGIISYYNKDKHQYFSAENPESLREVLNKKWGDLAKLETGIVDILPQLKSIYEKAGTNPAVRFYEGSAGVKNILIDVLDTVNNQKEKEYFVYSAANIREHLYRNFVTFTDERIKRQIRVRVIAIGRGGETAELSQRRWLNYDEKTASSYMIIYDGKVAMFSLNEHEEIFGVVFEDKQVAEMQKLLFEFIWKKV